MSSSSKTPSDITAYLEATTKNIKKLKKKSKDNDIKTLFDIAYTALSAATSKYEASSNPNIIVIGNDDKKDDNDDDDNDVKVIPLQDDGDDKETKALKWKLKLLATNAASREVSGPSRASRTLPTPPPAPAPVPVPAQQQQPQVAQMQQQQQQDANIEEFFEYLVDVVKSFRQNPDQQRFDDFKKAFQLKPRLCFIRRYNHWSKKKTGGANENILGLDYNEINDRTVLELFNQICNMPLVA